MLFASLEFLFLFLPIVLAVNFILPKKARNYWLMLASLFFYAWGEPKFLFIMILSILFNYFSALKITELRDGGKEAACKFTLIYTVIANILLLVVYKYLNFMTSCLFSYIPAASKWITQTSYILPIGISFFTFQAMSYVVDVYRGVKVQKNFGYLALYISMFPQLIAGPIVRYNTVNEQIEDRTVTVDMFAEGVLRFLRGFNKKVLLSNVLAIVADASWDMSDRTIIMAWFGALCYSLQIYFDFSGYSDMAIGLGKMLGFSYLENFNYPYISATISEFWRRWHISLSTWFRDYVYFPLGGSRVDTKRRLVFNLCAVWILTGIWHGANWTFIAWGCLYAFFICVEKLAGIEKLTAGHKLFRAGYCLFTLFVVMMLWVLFRSENLHTAWNYMGSMFGWQGNRFYNDITGFYIREYNTIFCAAVLCSFPLFKVIRKKLEHLAVLYKNTVFCQEFMMGISCSGQFLLFIVSISYLVISAHNPFIYFNF